MSRATETIAAGGRNSRPRLFEGTNHDDSHTILEAGTEGGLVALKGIESAQGWTYLVEPDESGLEHFSTTRTSARPSSVHGCRPGGTR